MNRDEELSTRDRLKLAARRLFAEKGVGGVTVRDILAEAGGKNGASLNYYFTSKEDLVREIIFDLFTMLEARWRRGLKALEAKQKNPDIREYIRILVYASNTSDVEHVPTAARLAETFSQQNYSMVTNVLKENRLNCYDLILAQIASRMHGVPHHIVRQRLVFLTRYLSSVFALYEIARTTGSERQRASLGADCDLGDVVDTAVGLLTAPVHDANAHLARNAMSVPQGVAEVLSFPLTDALAHG